MKITTKDYTIIKTKNYIKKTNLFFFLNGINRSSNDLILIEQNFKKLGLNCYKIYNRTSKKTLKNSIFLNECALINGITFFFKPILIVKEITKKKLLTDFEHLNFTLLALNLNNHIYSKTQLHKMFSFNYKESKLLFFKFNITNLKIIHTINKKI
jgi:hypothetical protein